jgi:glycerol-3-phosphate dehydrogenase (NAD(P)+)
LRHSSAAWQQIVAGKIAILGAGAWGTALAVMLARDAHPVTLCVRRGEQLDEIASVRENRAYLPGVAIPQTVALSSDWAKSVAECEVIVMAVPSRYARAAISPIASAVRRDHIVVSATKGIEENSLATMTAMLAEAAPGARAYAALSGPGFAAEVARGKPAALVAACADDAAALEVQKLFAAKTLRVYRSSDVIGVELSGAAKNVIAIAAGISDGLELGSSARAAVITRGLAELARLVEAAGGQRDTAMGLSGLGDLVLTCTGNLSRNRTFGIQVGREGGVKAAPEAHGKPVAEGTTNARLVKALAERHRVEVPIVDAVCRTLYEAEPPKAMVEELLSRALKAEF